MCGAEDFDDSFFGENPGLDSCPVLPVREPVSQNDLKPLKKAIFIELCAGSAKLSAACARAGRPNSSCSGPAFKPTPSSPSCYEFGSFRRRFMATAKTYL
jgi:hypothetical protein